MRTTTLIQRLENTPKSKVATPVKIRLTTMVRLGPSRSDTQPPRRPRNGPWTRDRASTVFAQLGCIACSLTRYNGSIAYTPTVELTPKPKRLSMSQNAGVRTNIQKALEPGDSPANSPPRP